MSGQFRIERRSATGASGRCRIGRTAPGTNCWLLGDDTDVMVVDAAGNPETIRSAVGGRRVVAVICTNGQRAHVSAAAEVAWGLCAPLLLHPADHALWESVHRDERYWWLDHGQEIMVAGEAVRVLHTPSPTLGSVSLHLARFGAVLTGDVLMPQVLAAHRRMGPARLTLDPALHSLSSSTRVYPGHGDPFLLDEALTSPADRLVRHSA